MIDPRMDFTVVEEPKQAPDALTMKAIWAEVIRSRLDSPSRNTLLSECYRTFGKACLSISATEIDDDSFDRIQIEIIRTAALLIRLLEEGHPGGAYDGAGKRVTLKP